MAAKKIAISVPEDVLKRVDRMAKRRKLSRSALISRALREISRVAQEDDIAERINRALAEGEPRENDGRAESPDFSKALRGREWKW